MSDLPISDATMDLSRLPAPEFVASLSFDAIRAARLTDLRERDPLFDALVESDPGLKLVESGAYRELLIRAAVNDAGRATLLAYATGADLDQVAARYGVTRLVIHEATDDAPAVIETDAEFRARVQISLERFAAGGMTAGGVRYRALTAAPSVADVGIVKRGGGQIDVILLGRDGELTDESIAAVQAVLTSDDSIGLTDIVAVRRANVIRYDVALTLRVRPGPDPMLIRTQAERSVRAFAQARSRVGMPIFADMLGAAAAIGGVDQVLVDIADIDPGADGAALLRTLTIVTEVIR